MSGGEVEAGTVVGETVRIERTIHLGPISSVYEASRLSPRRSPVPLGDSEAAALDAKCAAKVVAGSMGKDPRFRDLWKREAERWARVTSPYIVPCAETGTDEALGVAFAIFPLETGIPLASYLEKRQGKLDPSEAFRIWEQTALALATAHDAGLVHRDLKPEAILVADGPAVATVRLLVLGAGKLASEAKRNTTAAMSRPLWMAPEQAETDDHGDARDGHVGARSSRVLRLDRAPFLEGRPRRGLGDDDAPSRSPLRCRAGRFGARERARRRASSPTRLRRMVREGLRTHAARPFPTRA